MVVVAAVRFLIAVLDERLIFVVVRVRSLSFKDSFVWSLVDCFTDVFERDEFLVVATVVAVVRFDCVFVVSAPKTPPV